MPESHLLFRLEKASKMLPKAPKMPFPKFQSLAKDKSINVFYRLKRDLVKHEDNKLLLQMTRKKQV